METGERIPSCQYKFPNGQGDVGKFLDGLENSGKWEESNGSIYRIWSGTRPEMYVVHVRSSLPPTLASPSQPYWCLTLC